MLFFFELFLFVLVMLTLALGEFVSRGLALGLWGVMTVFALVGYLLARQSLRGLAGLDAPTPEQPASVAPAPDSTPPEPAAEPPSPLDEKWARTLLYNWRRTNVLLLAGVIVVGAWYWAGRG
jgi:hypothetical protein